MQNYRYAVGALLAAPQLGKLCELYPRRVARIQSWVLSGGKTAAVRPAKTAAFRKSVAAGFSEAPAFPNVIASRAFANGAVSMKTTLSPSRSIPNCCHNAGRSTSYGRPFILSYKF